MHICVHIGTIRAFRLQNTTRYFEASEIKLHENTDTSETLGWGFHTGEL
jgi:hypothetical protein